MARADAKRPRDLAKGLKGVRPWRFVPALLLIGGAIAYFALGLNQHVTLAAVQRNQTWLMAWTGRHPMVAPVAYIAIYAAICTLSVPSSAVFAFAGGVFFSVPLATLYSVIAVTVGDTIVYLSAGAAVSDTIPARLKTWLGKAPRGFPRNPKIYLLFIRLLPLTPSWLGNLGAVAFGVGLVDFIVITFIGVIPAHLMYVTLGNTLGALLEAGRTLSWADIFQLNLFLPLIGLAVLTLIYGSYRSRKGRE